MYFLKEYWSQTAFVQYPQEFMFYVVPAYSIIWILSIYLSGGYDAPIRLSKIVRGLFVGTVFILVPFCLRSIRRSGEVALAMELPWGGPCLLHGLEIRPDFMITDGETGIRPIEMSTISGFRREQKTGRSALSQRRSACPCRP